MVTLEEKGPTTRQDIPGTADGRTISFKESYLDNLVEAEALLEIVSRMMTHHDEILINPKAFMGVSIMLEKIARLIDIKDNLMPEDDTPQDVVLPPELDS